MIDCMKIRNCPEHRLLTALGIDFETPVLGESTDTLDVASRTASALSFFVGRTVPIVHF
jgi:hypothetical protein